MLLRLHKKAAIINGDDASCSFFLLVRSKLARHFGLSIRNRYTINNNVNFHGVYVCV